MYFKKFLSRYVRNTVPKIITTESALITGVTPPLRVMAEKMKIGRVDEPGPATKNVITKSSRERVIAVRNPEIIPGIQMGTVTLIRVSFSLAPKSWAASMMEKSNSSSRAITMRKTKGRLNVVWAAKIVNNPRGTPVPAKKIESETPMIISGSIIGRKEVICT